MRYLALAADYDGTIATHGRVSEETLDAFVSVAESGRKLVLVTGRELPDLLQVFPEADIFDRIVAENGALLYRPDKKEETMLAEAPPAEFVTRLQRQIPDLAHGRVIVATGEPNETLVLDMIREMGLELQVIFNKGSVMALPSGVNKASGLTAALDELLLAAHNVAGIGDAENDHAFLSICECAVAVADAVPTLKERADLVTKAGNGAGVVELCAQLLENDLEDIDALLVRRYVPLGTDERGEEVKLPPWRRNLLFSGSSGSGKSTLATGFLEGVRAASYQFCIVDPEGDYEAFEGAVTLGTPERAPSVEEVLQLLEKPAENAVVNLLGVPLADRPLFFAGLLPRLQEMRAATGRPHWVVVDEAHHLMPTTWESAPLTLPQELDSLLFITVHPEMMSPAALSTVDWIIAVGESPQGVMRAFSGTVGQEPPVIGRVDLVPGEALVWDRERPPFKIEGAPSRREHRRHRRKYAEGDLGDHSFYFRGPDGRLNLRAQNLVLFSQIAEGVDDETWLHHLREGHYSRWFREAIKDEELAAAAERLEKAKDVSADESRRLILDAINERYTLPASAPT
jgi:HAD superfamily hydrolase (TIGR01484 family)